LQRIENKEIKRYMEQKKKSEGEAKRKAKVAVKGEEEELRN